ncbi:MAG: hypothetical protein ACRCUP_06340 [Mycoplasmatales bacterium]
MNYVEIMPNQNYKYISLRSGTPNINTLNDSILVEYPDSYTAKPDDFFNRNIFSLMSQSGFLIESPPNQIEEIIFQNGLQNNIRDVYSINDVFKNEIGEVKVNIKGLIISLMISITGLLIISIYSISEFFEQMQTKISIRYVLSKKIISAFKELLLITLVVYIPAFIYSLRYDDFTNEVIIIFIITLIVDCLIYYFRAKTLLRKNLVRVLKG